jgi:hypothetical protein
MLLKTSTSLVLVDKNQPTRYNSIRIGKFTSLRKKRNIAKQKLYELSLASQIKNQIDLNFFGENFKYQKNLRIMRRSTTDY